ncbi:hypothetical protein ACHAXR_011843 [Thalassiosira sp. AJA248-18]
MIVAQNSRNTPKHHKPTATILSLVPLATRHPAPAHHTYHGYYLSQSSIQEKKHRELLPAQPGSTGAIAHSSRGLWTTLGASYLCYYSSIHLNEQIHRRNIMNGKMDYVQIMFALSPFPAYLPQYFTMMRQLAPAESNVADDPRDADGGNVRCAVAHHMNMEREGEIYFRKRNLPDSPIMDASIASPPNTAGAAGLVPGTPSKPLFEQRLSQNGDGEDNGSSKLDTGLSRATVLLLLSAHLLRLLYFHGIILEEQKPVPPRAGAGLELDELISPTQAAASTPASQIENSALQWDLLGQSISMIVVQFMLLHALMLLRRTRLKRQRKRISDYVLVGHESTDSLLSTVLTESPPRSGPFILSPSSPDTNYNNNSSHTANNNNNSTSFWKSKWSQLSRAIRAHFYHLFSPHNILQKHSLLEYLELLFLTSMAVKLVFDHYWYPRYRMEVVERLKHTSIVLESCLALPQAIRNHRKGTTEGLSVVMVGGWVAGDLFKLCYFLFNMIGSGGADGNAVFVLGCLLAILLDSIVGIQMARNSPEALKWQQRILRSVRHNRSNKDAHLS